MKSIRVSSKPSGTELSKLRGGSRLKSVSRPARSVHSAAHRHLSGRGNVALWVRESVEAVPGMFLVHHTIIRALVARVEAVVDYTGRVPDALVVRRWFDEGSF